MYRPKYRRLYDLFLSPKLVKINCNFQAINSYLPLLLYITMARLGHICYLQKHIVFIAMIFLFKMRDAYVQHATPFILRNRDCGRWTLFFSTLRFHFRFIGWQNEPMYRLHLSIITTCRWFKRDFFYVGL